MRLAGDRQISSKPSAACWVADEQYTSPAPPRPHCPHSNEAGRSGRRQQLAVGCVEVAPDQHDDGADAPATKAGAAAVLSSLLVHAPLSKLLDAAAAAAGKP